MRWFCIIFVMLLMAGITRNSIAGADFNPPKTKSIPVVDTIHGFIFTDFYRWLEDKENPEVKDWSHRQHDYTIDYINKNMHDISGMKDEIRAYLDRDYIGAPFFEGYREFYYARKKGEQQSKLYTKIDGKEMLIFDPMTIDPTGKTAITSADFTRDGNKVAIGAQFQGNEINTFRIIDTKTGKQIGDEIENLAGFNWTIDEKHAYLTERTREMVEKQVPLRTYLHKLGDDRKNDIFLVAPEDAKDNASVWDPDEGNVTFFSEGDFYSNTLKIRPAGSMSEPKTLYSSKKFLAQPHIKGSKIYIYTNYEAPNYKLMVTDLNKPEFENWKDLYPEKETVLENYVVTDDYIIIQDKKDVLSRLSVYDLNGKFIQELKLPEIGNVGGMSYHKETNNVYVTLTTFTAPSVVYKLYGKTLKWEFFYQDKPPIDTKNIESKQVFYYSKDSTRVPMFICYKKGMKLDGNNPTKLSGYGGFNIDMGPRFLGTTASFINRGGVYAIACLRGGGEYGEKWHEAGMLDNKQNGFDDFIAAAEYLFNEKYTSPDKLLIEGGSNGGLLVGAVMTQRPDICKAVVCAVPLLDMLRYHKFLIARYWIPEYGDPDKEHDFLNILKYSPYQNIKEGFNYPTALVKAGENDVRVDPLHAKKFAAALQNLPGQYNPVFLFVDFQSGHGSGKSIEQQVDDVYIDWKYIMNELGMR